jgi:putative membrane protein insertion efficiency factor
MRYALCVMRYALWLISMNILDTISKKLIQLLIKFYQLILSPDHSFWGRYTPGRTCIHYPSCSHYTYEAVEKHGAVKGLVMGSARILRCNPWSRGGLDPVPEKFSLKRSES